MKRIKMAGFTLVEMAVVLVIMGLTLGAVLGVSSTQLQSSRISATKQKEELIRLALENFIARNNRLPCPAIATLAKGAVGYGVEAINPGTCTGTVITGAVSTGVVPWISLGISDENASDGYYTRFTYQITSEATNRTAFTISGLRGAIVTHTTAPVLPANQSNNCTPMGHAYNPCSIVVMILSHGANKFGGYSDEGVQTPLPTTADELENANADNAFVIKDFSDNSANPFDDILLPLNSNDLLTPLWSRGIIKDYQSKFNDDQRDIIAAVAADAHSHRSVAVDPGTGLSVTTYLIPSDLPGIAASAQVDPWGVNYKYVRSINSVTSATLGSTVIATITSFGPDSTEGTADDVPMQIQMSNLAPIFGASGW